MKDAVENRQERAGVTQPVDKPTAIRDVVEGWVSENPGPKHIVLKGKSYSDFIRNCYLFLLVHALRHGASSTGVLIGEDDCRQIAAFLDRAKALWDVKLCEEEARAEERRLAEERREEREKRRAEAEAVRQAEEKRITDLIRESKELINEARQRLAEARRNEAQHQVKEASSNNEQSRVEQILLRHRKAVEDEYRCLLDGRCAPADYYAYVLRDRLERSAELLFGSATCPSYEIIKKDSGLLGKLRGLSFGDNCHPSNYDDPYVSSYYALRYEAGYAFEYSQIYGMLLDVMRQQAEEAPFDVLSIGSGQGLDYWGLRYALSKRGLDQLKIGWHGVDLETWPDHILDDGVALYSDGIDVCDLLAGIDKLDVKVLMFPKVICEMPHEVISAIAAWLERVTFTRDVHYLCFAHTERKSLDPSNSKHKGAPGFFHGASESSLDAVKSAALISAACKAANGQSYSIEFELPDAEPLSVSHYDVVWPTYQSGREPSWPYSYLVYNRADGNDWPVWRDDATFKMDAQLRSVMKEMGCRCCPSYIPSEGTDCDIRRVGCNNPGSCPLYKYPRFMTGRIAYQIVRLVNQASPYDEDIPF